MRCPACNARWHQDANDDGEPIRVDAVYSIFERGELQALGCRVCVTEWRRGPDLDALVDWARQLAA